MKFGDRPLLRSVADLLMLVGIASMLLFAWTLLDGTYYQYMQRLRFDKELAGTEVVGGSGEIAKEIALPEARPQPEGAFHVLPNLPKLPGRDPMLIGELVVPHIGLSVMVREGMDAVTLRRAVGHVPSTALPGQPGNFVLLGHRDTFFRRLRELERGDTVQISTTRGRFTYAVESIEVVEPEGISLSALPSETVATLITCFPFNYVGTAPRRFVARARFRDATPSGEPR
jgi:sortase A